MASFWRYRASGWTQDGLMATYALREIAGPHRWQGTILDEPMLRQSRARLRRHLRTQPDVFLDAVLEMTEGDTIFAPYRLAASLPCRSSPERPLQAAVGPCRMHHDAAARAMTLRVADDAVTIDLRFDLPAAGLAMGGAGAWSVDGLNMRGYTHPRVVATGTLTVDGHAQPVSGEAWHDHQWGDWTFAKGRRNYHHPEWHYFAVLLDDGRRLSIYRWQRPGQNGPERFFAEGLKPMLWEPDRAPRALDHVAIAARDYVESLRTNNLYEYGWTVDLSALDGTLELMPFHPDHEVFVFTRQRGLLEVGCHVSGTLQGRPCRGVAFVEAFGETADINRFFWGQRKTNLARQLERFMPRRFDAAWLQRVCGADAPLAVDPDLVERAIIQPIWSMMDRGGKGWRSTWLMTCCHALGYDRFDHQIRELLPVIEMLHTGSLIVDDIQDRSPLRRGQPTLHRQIGTDLAINVGNFLYFLPLLIIQEARWLSETQRAGVYTAVINAMRQGHLGQAMDLMCSQQRYDVGAKVTTVDRTRGELLEQYRLKSGCQMEAIARIAGIIAGAPRHQVEALEQYSRTFGVVFQIVDDVMDVQEGREKLGKKEGEDLRNGKLNMVLLHAFAGASPADRDALLHLMRNGGSGNGDAARALDTARDIIDRTGAVNHCLVDAEAMMQQAWQGLACLPATDAKIVMRSVPKWLLHQRRVKQRELDAQPGAMSAPW